MIGDRKNIDKLFHDALFEDEHDVPNYVWDNIKDELLNKKHRRIRILLRNIAASIIIMLTFASGYFFTDIFRIEKEKSSQTVIKKPSLKAKEIKKDKNSDKDFIKNNKTVNNELNTQKQDNITFNNKNQNDEFLANTDKKHSEIYNIKKQEKVHEKELLASSNEENNSNKILTKTTYNDKIIYKKLKLKNADKINIQLKSEEELIYSFRQVPILNIDLEKKKEPRWSVEGQFSPLYAFRDVKNVDAVYEASANSNNSIYSNNPIEQPISAFSVGANIKYKVSDRIKFQTGIYYSETGQVTKDAMLFSESMYDGIANKYLLNTTVGNVIEASNSLLTINDVDNLDFSSLKNSDIIQNFNYIEIPAIIKYKIIDKKFDVNVLSGLNTGVLVGNNVKIKNDEGKFKVGKTTDINSVIYSGVFGVNIVYPLFKNFSFCIEPTFKYSLKSINKFNSVYPYSFAVFSGINFQFQ